MAALIGNGLISIAKFTAATITGSSAMLSEGIHSVVDTGNQVLLLYGLKQAQKPPDELFPFGHGKEVYFWSFVVAILIFGIGAGISIYEGISQVLNPHAIESPNVNYLVLGIALIIEGAAWYLAFREFRKIKGERGYMEAVRRSKDPSVFLILFEDSAAMLGLMIAAIGVYMSSSLGYLWLDGVASIFIGFVLAGTATWIAVETKGLLIGERANIDIVNGIHSLTADFAQVNKVHEVLTMHMGPEFILVNISAKFSDTATALEIESAIEEMDRAIKASYPRVKRVFIGAKRTPATGA